jgi:hypothetical protein
LKFSQAQLGTRAERSVEIDVRGTHHTFALRPLTGTEEGIVLERATEYATAKHAAKVESGNPLFDLGIMLHSLALACVDVDSPEGAREAFWDNGAAQIADSLDTEQIAYLYAIYERWQGECSPTQKAMSAAQMVDTLIGIAGSDGDDSFFDRMPLGILVSCLRITAKLLVTSPEGRSALTSLSDTSTSPH